jgi:hypothetical protein
MKYITLIIILFFITGCQSTSKIEDKRFELNHNIDLFEKLYQLNVQYVDKADYNYFILDKNTLFKNNFDGEMLLYVIKTILDIKKGSDDDIYVYGYSTKLSKDSDFTSLLYAQKISNLVKGILKNKEIKYKGMGELYPIYKKNRYSEYIKNERVEIYFVKRESESEI